MWKGDQGSALPKSTAVNYYRVPAITHRRKCLKTKTLYIGPNEKGSKVKIHLFNTAKNCTKIFTKFQKKGKEIKITQFIGIQPKIIR